MQDVGLFEGKFRQIAWITNDMDAAMAAFARDYSVPRWLDLRELPIQTGPDGAAMCNVALAVRGGVEFELIQPLGGADKVYSQVLTDEPGLQVRFHHICYRLETLEALEAVRERARQAGRSIVLEGGTPSGVRYFYTDERARLGHHVEYIYYPPADLEQLTAAVPAT
jgi:hypothetical protein